jgi:hypothetical protein
LQPFLRACPTPETFILRHKVAFLDEEEALEVSQEPETRGHVPRPERVRRRQQFVLRRLIAVGVGVAFLILFVLGVRGCLDARKERGIRNYSEDLRSVLSESTQTGEKFFDQLENPGDLTALQYQAEVRSLRGTAENLLNRAEKIDTPGEMSSAQQAVEFSLQLRRDALETIANEAPTALGRENRTEAIDAITQQMGSLFASDVLLRQEAVPEIIAVVDEEGVQVSDLPDGRFMPEANPEEWLDQTTITDALAGISGAEASAPGIHGLGLVQVSIGDTTLSPDTETTVGGDSPEVKIEIANQGEAEETQISVVVSIGGEEQEATLDKLGPGETGSVNVPIPTPPAAGESVTVEVEVQPVPGEQVTDNNSASYPVTFQ